MDLPRPTVSLILGTLNEIDGLKWFMPRLKKEWFDEIVVVDGGSTDGTIDFCRNQGIPIFIQSKKGLPNAYDEAFERTSKEIIITITPDGNSLPEMIPVLVEKIHQGFDMVIASRYLDSAKSYDDDIFTAFGNRIFTKLINFLFDGHYTDTLVGLRAYRRSAIEKMRLCRMDEQGWLNKKFFLMNSWETGASIRAAKLKLKVAEVPADEPKRIGGVRKMRIVRNGFGTLLQVIYEYVIGCRFLHFSS